MKNIIQLYNLQPGDRIVTPKSRFGVIEHHAIVLGKNNYGQDLIGENVFGHLVRATTVDEFTRENLVISKIIRFEGTGLQRRQAVENALRLMGQPYSLINFNCEHFANYVQRGVFKSDQVGLAFVLLGIVAIAVLAD